MLSWEQAIHQAATVEAAKEKANTKVLEELQRQLVDANSVPSLPDMYTSKQRIRAALKNATLKDINRVLSVAAEMRLLLEDAERRQDQITAFRAKLYNVWQENPQGQTFDQFLASL